MPTWPKPGRYCVETTFFMFSWILFCSSLLTPFGHPFGTLYGHTFDQKAPPSRPRGVSRNLRKHHMAWLFLGSARDFLGSAWDFSGSASKISFYALSGVPRLIFWTKRCSKRCQNESKMNPETILNDVHKTVPNKNMELMFAPKFALSFPTDIFTIFDEWTIVVKI